MKIAYLDCLSGVSGDMMLGALVDVGAPLEAIQSAVDSLGLPSCTLQLDEVRKHGFRAAKVSVVHDPEHAHRHLHHITEMIDGSDVLSAAQKDLAKRIFAKLGQAEAKVHGSTIEKVHFHEVGAVDSIADIVGAAVAWDLLGVDRIVSAPVPTGHGSIQIAHGRVSIPAPATAELLKGIPLAACVVESELTTPTGAAIVATMVDEFGPMPAMTIDRIGCGAGDRDLKEQANVLRVVVGETGESGESVDADQVWVLETNVDDVTGETIGHCTELLMKRGALDVYTTAIQMKKNRPGIVLSVLCRGDDVAKLERIIFRETGTLGIRRWSACRHKLERETASVTTEYGEVAGKTATIAGDKCFSPEYESCRAIAEQNDIPLRAVYESARKAFDSLEQN
jgi:pyridinium-3,5-bisthiocarboxylic acid mononucleotide nickel chelatase